MVRMPPVLSDAIEAARAALATRPTHELSIRDRLPIYAALTSEGAEVAYRARVWLDIHAARHVLHHATQAVPAEAQLAVRDLELATQLVDGSLNPEASEVLARLKAGLPDLDELWPADATINTSRVNGVLIAARLTLWEAAGHVVGGERLAEYRVRKLDGSWLLAEDWSDSALMFTGASDPAAPASVAASFDERYGRCDARDLLRFWEDWLSFGVPGAWDAAHRPVEIDNKSGINE